MNTLKIALIGAGEVARRAHMPSYEGNPRAEVTAIADPNLEAAQTLAERYAIPKTTVDYHELLQDTSIAAVDICVPHYFHYQIAMDALNAGKHVIIDKPIAMNLEEADHLISTARELDLRLLVVLNERFMPIHRMVKELIADKRLGQPFLVNAFITGNMLPRLNDPTDWISSSDRAGGGAFFSTGIHLVDLMRSWFGDPTSVIASMKRILTTQNKSDDNASVILEWNDDLIANLVVSYTVANEPWSEKKFIYGTGADISMISETTVPMFIVEDGVPSMLEVDHRADWWPWSIGLALSHFVDVILDGAEPLVTAEDARAALKIVLAAYQSAKEGQKVTIGT